MTAIFDLERRVHDAILEKENEGLGKGEKKDFENEKIAELPEVQLVRINDGEFSTSSLHLSIVLKSLEVSAMRI